MVRKKGQNIYTESESDGDSAKRPRNDFQVEEKENAAPFIQPEIPVSQPKPNGELSCFQAVLEKVGVAFPDQTSSDARFELLKDRAIVARDLIQELQMSTKLVSMSSSAEQRGRLLAAETKRRKDAEVKQGNFLQGFKQFVQDPENFRTCLKPTEKKLSDQSRLEAEEKELEGLPESEVQDSVCRLLLQIDPIQSKIAQILFQRLNDISKAQLRGVRPEDIINQFRYLEFVKDSHTMAEHLFDGLESSQGVVKEQLILCIPELILDPETQKKAVDALVEFHMETTRIIGVCLQAMANLAVGETVFYQILDKVKIHKDDFKAEEWLPILEFFFAWCQSSPAHAKTVLADFRTMLDCETLLLGNDPTDGRRRRKKDVESAELRILHLFHQTFRFKKAVREGARAVLQEILSFPENAKVIDVIFLLILHAESGSSGKRDSSLLKLKAQQGFLDERVLAAALNVPVIRHFFFDSLKGIAPEFLRSPVIAIAKFSVLLFQVAFRAFTTFEEKFELIRSLLEHIGHGVETETDYALEVLKSLASSSPEKLEEFGGIISSVSDSLDELSYSQIKTFLETLALLARVNQDDTDSTLDDLNRLVAKCLPSAVIRSKLIGVLAALMLIKTLWIKSDNRSEDENSEIERLVHLVVAETKHDNYARALLMEELAHIIPLGTRPHVPAIVALKKEILDKLEQTFFIGSYEASEYVKKFKSPVFDVEVHCRLSSSDQEEGYVLNLIELAKHEPFTHKASLFLLCPFLKLSKACGNVTGNNYGSRIAPIKVPLLIPSLDSKITENSPEEVKTIFCRAYFHAVNWIRLVMNLEGHGLSFESLPLLKRLSDLCACEKQLIDGLKEMESFDIPIVDFQFDPENLPCISNSKGATQNVKSKKRKLSGDTSSADGNGGEVADPEEPGPSTRAKKEATSPIQSRKKYAPEQIGLFLQELDIQLLRPLLKAPLHIEEIDGEDSFEKGVFLRESHLAFLLQDFSAKLTHSLSGNVAKRLPAWKSKAATVEFRKLDSMSKSDIFNEALKTLPSLRQHMNKCKDLFEDIITDTDGIVDSDKMSTYSVVTAEKCLNHILATLKTLLQRRGADLESDRESEEIKIIEAFLDQEEFSQHELEHSSDNPFEKLFEYLKKFSEKTASLGNVVALIGVLRAIPIETLSNDKQEYIGNLADKSLQREWPDTPRGASFTLQLKALIEAKIHFTVEDKLKGLQDFTEIILRQMTSQRDEEDPSYNTADKHTWQHYFSTFLYLNAELAKKIRKRQRLDGRKERTECIREWIKAFNLFYTLLAALRDHEVLATPGVRASALKLGRQVLEASLSADAGFFFIVEVHAKEQLHEAITAVGLANKGKRILQNICTDANKGSQKSQNVIRLIPEAKATNEEFLRRLKSAMIYGKMEDTFQIGVLKCRNLKGERLSDEEIEEEENDEQAEGAEEEGTEGTNNDEDDNETNPGTENPSDGAADESE